MYRTIKYKVGDCIKRDRGIGKIIEVDTEDGQVLWEVDFLQMAKSFETSGIFNGGIIKRTLYLSPLGLSRYYKPATEEDYQKALKILQMGDMTFEAILKKDNSVTK